MGASHQQCSAQADELTPGEQSHSAEVTAAELKDAEKEYLEARAAYILRQSVVEDVLVTDPILKAVHSGSNATSTERYMDHTNPTAVFLT